MGNKSNLDQWSALERLRYIERSAYWRGVVNRQDLARVFGLSMAQASADLQKYQEVNPGALAYNLNRKRYEGTAAMAMVLGGPVLEEAMAEFLSGGSEALGVMRRRSGDAAEKAEGAEVQVQVRVVRMPVRRPLPAVERRVFLAVLNGWRVRVRYYSIHSGTDDWRWLRPRTFVHDGNRWHVRAWCELREHWADFTLSRMADAEWPVPGEAPPVVDEKALRLATIRLRACRDLPATARRGVEMEYGMKEGALELTVSAAVAGYLRARLGLPLEDGAVPPALVEAAEDEVLPKNL